MAYQYGTPGTTEIGRPRCWGNPAEYNPDLRECRNCTFQSSCRDNVVRIKNYAQPYAQPGYVQPGYPPQGFQQPNYAPVPAPGYVPAQQPRSAPVPVPVHVQQQPQQLQQQRPIYPPPQMFEYGWLQDPMYQAMSACPPPIRPQLPGENFWERVMKNMFLAAGESFFMHGFLAMRQLVLPPEQPGTQMVDVPPHHNNQP